MNFPLKRRRKEPMGLREPSHIECPGHRKWTRGHCCLIEGRAGHVCHGKIEAHHVREGRHGGMNIKHDDTVVPLCSLAHTTFHAMGHASFRLKYGVDLPALAADLWRRSPHRLKYEKKQGA